jgi:hypothetical protein
MFLTWLKHLDVSQSVYLFFKLYLIFMVSYVLFKYLSWNPDTNNTPNPKIREAFKGDDDGKESFASSGQLQFIDAATTAKFLLHDDDRYVQGMSKSDLEARKVVCQEAYRLAAYYAAQDFNDEQRALLTKATQEADQFFARYNGQVTSTGKGGYPTSIAAIAYFDAERARQLPWNLMLVSNAYEEGLPHTRGDYIFISPTVLAESYLDLVETLIHEKIHIYQRRYAREQTYLEVEKKNVRLTEYMVSKMGFVKVKRRSESACDLRANPDLDDWIYRDPKTNQEMMACYRSSRPTGITDVVGDVTREHPYEWIAYEISKRYKETK